MALLGDSGQTENEPNKPFYESPCPSADECNAYLARRRISLGQVAPDLLDDFRLPGDCRCELAEGLLWWDVLDERLPDVRGRHELSSLAGTDEVATVYSHKPLRSSHLKHRELDPLVYGERQSQLQVATEHLLHSVNGSSYLRLVDALQLSPRFVVTNEDSPALTVREPGDQLGEIRQPRKTSLELKAWPFWLLEQCRNVHSGDDRG